MEAISEWLSAIVGFYQSWKDLFFLYFPAICGFALLLLFGYYNFNTPPYPLAYREPLGESPQEQTIKPERVALEETKALAPPLFTTRRKVYRRYRRWYIAGLSTIFVVFVFYPETSEQVAAISGVPWDLPESLNERVMLCLLTLMGVATSVPVLKDWHRLLLRKLHGLAIIPADARITARHLFEDSQYDPPKSVKQKALSEMGNTLPKEIDPQKYLPDLRDELNALEYNWFKLSCLFVSVMDELKGTGAYKRFNQIFELEIEAIKTEYDKRRERMRNYYEALARIAPESEGDGTQEPSPDQASGGAGKEGGPGSMDDGEDGLSVWGKKLNFKNEVVFFRICLLACLLTFASKRRIGDVFAKFKALGFTASKRADPLLSWDVMIIASLWIIGLCFGSALIYEVVRQSADLVVHENFKQFVPQSSKRAFGTSAIVVVLHMMCLLGGVALKRICMRRRTRQPSPAGQYTIENAIIFVTLYALTLGVGVAAFSILLERFVFIPGLAWAIVPATTGVFAGHYMDRVELATARVWNPILLHSSIVTIAALLANLITVGVYDVVDLQNAGSLFWVNAAKGALLSGLLAVAIGIYFPRAHLARLSEVGARSARTRPARMADLDAISACISEANKRYAPHISRDMRTIVSDFEDAIENKRAWVLETMGICIGALILIPDDEDGTMVVHAAIRPSFQGKRLGRRLHEIAEKEMHRLDGLEMRVYAHEEFLDNINYYQRLGYEKKGSREFRGVRLIAMIKELGPTEAAPSVAVAV